MTDPTELRRLAEAATPGPWDQAEGRRWRVYAGDVLVAAANAATHAGAEANGDYIAAMHPQTTLALLDRLAELEALLEQARMARTEYRALRDRIRDIGNVWK